MTNATSNTMGITLSWIVVKDLKEAIKFYSEVIGLEVVCEVPEFGWAELKGSEGSRLGIAQENDKEQIKAGQNAIMAIKVNDIMQARDTLLKKGAKLLGDVQEVPGHVKLQTFADSDGNVMQLAQEIN